MPFETDAGRVGERASGRPPVPPAPAPAAGARARADRRVPGARRPLAAALVACGILLGAAPLAAQRPPVPGWSDFTRRFDAYADSGRIVGASALLVRDGRIAARHHFGFADRARNQRVDDNTLFHYGSITKTLTAISVLQLRDRGRLALGDPIVRWVPELRQVHDPYGAIDSVTLRMLLSHSAGFQNPTWPYTSGKAWEPFEPTTWNQLVAMMPYQELHFRPGSRFGYSNPGYIYLARVIEQLSGDPWEAYVQKNIFTPLGLGRSYFGATPYWLAADRSNNYSVLRDSAGKEAIRENGRDFDPGITIPNGGWNAPLEDLATYALFLLGETGGDAARARRYDIVLPRATLQEMWRPVVPTDSTGTQSLGLGFFILRSGADTFVGHTGSQAGFRAFLWLNPAKRAAAIAVVNTENENPGAFPTLGRMQEAMLELIR
ncbi:MAG TPA: serine hydrolase domain-containing protein [Longimicrobiales bacterium]|nr:serine hydrolase domain-containing protein [Longimicrobiales bacterium]